MNVKQHLQTLHDLLGIVLNSLDGGQPFCWGNGQRMAWVPMLKEVGVTLVTKNQIEKRGFRLKRGVKPVGSAYFGAPIKRQCDLYVLEVQCTLPKPVETDCWLFLDCQVMTGQPPEKCPNRKACKQNALHSSNRSCYLPYEVYDPKLGDNLFDCRQLVVSSVTCEKSALAAGWHPAESLFYDISRKGVMLIGKMFHGNLNVKIPEAAALLGFARAEETPYWLNSKPECLVVTRYCPMSSYPTHFKEAGWYPAVKLPYCILPDWDNRDVSVLKVFFPDDDPEYAEALAAGWYPACDLKV